MNFNKFFRVLPICLSLSWLPTAMQSTYAQETTRRQGPPTTANSSRNSADETQPTQDNDWARWRGPRGDGTWNAPPLPEKFPDVGLKQLWRQPVGGGYAGVIVAKRKVYLADRQLPPNEHERIACFDADSGRPLWQYTYSVEYGDLQYGTGPRAAVTVHEGRVYSVGALGAVCCLDADTGTLLWSADFVSDFAGRPPTWGYAASPLVIGELVILLPGGKDGNSIVALNRQSGKTVWHSLADEAAYATPLLINNHGRAEIVCWTPSHIRAIEPATGKLLWSLPYEVTMGVSIATPIFAEGTVLVSGYWEGSKAVQLGQQAGSAKLLWEENRHLRGLMSQPLYREGYGYLLDKQYGIVCFEFATGQKIWDDGNTLTPRGRNPQASLVWLNNSDRVIALNANGELILARLSPSGYEEQSRTSIIGETWAHPAYVGSRVFARSDTELVCVSLTEPKTVSPGLQGK